MSKLSKKDDFHAPFIKNLAFVGLVTIVSMISAHFLLVNYLPTIIKTHIYTTQESQIQSK
jgi:uncharacterized membrane protein